MLCYRVIELERSRKFPHDVTIFNIGIFMLNIYNS